MYGEPQLPAPRATPRPIVKPGAPDWLSLFAEPKPDRKMMAQQLGGALVILAFAAGIFGAVTWLGTTAPVIATVLIAALVGGGCAAWRAGVRRFDRYVDRRRSGDWAGSPGRGPGEATQ